MDNELISALHGARAWLTQAIEQMYDRRPKSLDLSDVMTRLEAINKLRSTLEAEGIHVPRMRDPKADPLGNMIDWREFLDKQLPLS